MDEILVALNLELFGDLSGLPEPDSIRLMNGDCLQVMAGLPDNSVDSIVTDPPYGLSFMGKGWDKGVPCVEIWVEALRVLKPGGHLLAFAGTRTQHRMATAIEDAGFEIRDMVSYLYSTNETARQLIETLTPEQMKLLDATFGRDGMLAWIYGSGFPKSLDVSKAIDKMGGQPAPVAFAEWLRTERERRGMTVKELCERGKFYKNINHGGLVSNWENGIGFPSAEQFNLLCDLIELPFGRREEVQREILGWRQVVPGVAFSSSGPTELPVTTPTTPEARQWDGWGTGLKPALEPITMARKPLNGTVAANVLEHGTGALNIDGCRVSGQKPSVPQPKGGSGDIYGFKNGEGRSGEMSDNSKGRWPANLIHDGSDEVVGLFPVTTSGKPGTMRKGTNDDAAYGAESRPPGTPMTGFGDSGSAARFFYCAKASKRDRDEGLEQAADKVLAMSNQAKAELARGNMHSGESGMNTAKTRKNNHPTVKPTDLMRYLCRLVTPPGGTVLDPFMGSGSTGKAAKLEGFGFIGIEVEPEYVEIARARINKLSSGDRPGSCTDPQPDAPAGR